MLLISETEAAQIDREIEAQNLRLARTPEETTAAWVYPHGRLKLLVVELAPHFGPVAPTTLVLDRIVITTPVKRRRLRG
jgi:hypothetical protein